MDPDFKRLAAAWPRLTADVKAAILALVDAVPTGRRATEAAGRPTGEEGQP